MKTCKEFFYDEIARNFKFKDYVNLFLEKLYTLYYYSSYLNLKIYAKILFKFLIAERRL